VDAIILAAGEGIRFFGGKFEARQLPAGLEYPIPKTLFPVGLPGKTAERKPILAHLVGALFEGGIEKVYITTGYLGEKIVRFVSDTMSHLNIEIIPPNPAIDYRKGPLYTLAGALNHFVEHGILTSKGFDRMVMLSPSDLVIDRRAPYFVTGIPARDMMASRSRLHVIVENRDGSHPWPASSSLKDLIPARLASAVHADVLACPVVPMMAVHVDILMEAVGYLNRGATKFAEFLKSWLDEHVKDDHEFLVDVNIIPAMHLGKSFYWQDIDTFDSVKTLEKPAKHP